jgi:hypothetical protein
MDYSPREANVVSLLVKKFPAFFEPEFLFPLLQEITSCQASATAIQSRRHLIF